MSTICRSKTDQDPLQPLVAEEQKCEGGFKIARNFRLVRERDGRQAVGKQRGGWTAKIHLSRTAVWS